MARSISVPARLRRLVVRRADALCEYCHLQQELCPEPFEIDHIVPRSARGRTRLANLCLACPVCNNAKRDRTLVTDPVSGRRQPLFNPQHQKWDRHFHWSEDFGCILGRTAMGRASVAALDMNHMRVVRIRLLWATIGLHPPR
jgi:hypothetical protein